MEVVIKNDFITLKDLDFDIESDIKKHLSYVDKSKKYQLDRMKRNPFMANSIAAKKISNEIYGSLYELIDDKLVIPSGFSYLLNKYNLNYIDKRSETGDTISLPWKDVSKAINLRDYQQEAVDVAAQNWRGIINLATGLGKSKIAISLVKTLKRKTLIICPSKAIANQFYKELVEFFGAEKIGFIGDNKYKPSAVTVGIAASICNRIDDIKQLKLGVIIFDETHHTPANTFYAIANGLGAVGRMYGLTATAFRSDGKDVFIYAACGNILVERDVSWGVANNWLSKPYFIVRSVDTDGFDFKNDKLKAYKAHVLNCKMMNDRIISDSRAFIKHDKKVLILVDQIDHGDLIAKELNVSFANGRDKGSEKFIDDFNYGKLNALIATDGLVGEGVDTKNVEILVMANFMASKAAVLQAVGRGLRKTDTKDTCIILDYIPNGSTMLSRHARQRISFYKEITHNVKVQ